MTTTGVPAPPTDDLFELRFSSTARGARLARRLASHRVHTWGHRYGSEVNDTVSLIVGELAANAVTHGLVPGRDAQLRLVRLPPESEGYSFAGAEEIWLSSGMDEDYDFR